MSRASESISQIRKTAEDYRRLAQFLPRDQAEALAAGADALETRAARIERRRVWPRAVRKLIGRA